ncbi:hypothetical protein [Pseudobacillus badius]|uniref:hypothetical protein n=1 Tax=Bacillus badius TaxID=1455 RepID=UPI0024A4CAF3|nr:hypothetical protein [Bacillus badius]GLY09614.1 hypothetical protein Bbad01_08300 [Bacillus badius]
MNRITSQSITSMCYIFFNCISQFEIDKDSFPCDPSLKVERPFDEIIVREVDAFLHHLSYIPVDIESGYPGAQESLKHVKKTMFQTLASMEVLGTPDFVKKLFEFIKEKHPDMEHFFEDIVHEARILREKMLKNDDPGRLVKLIKDVLAIYEEADGNPDHSKKVECPICEMETANYACAWEINKHVHFSCEHCGMSLMQ